MQTGSGGLTWFPHKCAAILCFKENLHLQKQLDFTYMATRKHYYRKHFQKEKFLKIVQNNIFLSPCKAKQFVRNAVFQYHFAL